jgi:hypothetical protein
MDRFVKQFGKQHLLGLLAGREFVGGNWTKWLQHEKIHFAIRIKKDAKVPNGQGESVQVKSLFRFLKPGEQTVIQGPRKMTGADVHLTGLRLSDGELLIVAADQPSGNAIGIYKERWQIEIYQTCCLHKSVFKKLMCFVSGLIDPDTPGHALCA